MISVLALLFLALPLAAEEGSRDLRLLEIQGEVQVKNAEGVWQTIPDGTVSVPLEEGEVIKTGAKSEATLQLDKDNTIELSELTDFEITSSKLAWTRFKLNAGKIFAKIEEKLQQRRRNMTLNTHTAVMAVRGTEFAVEIPQAENDTGGMAVFEGQVEVASAEEGASPVYVSVNQEAEFSKSGPPRVQALKRFAAHKKRMILMRKKHASLKAKWRQLPLERRRAIRSKIQHRMRQNLRERENLRRKKTRRGTP